MESVSNDEPEIEDCFFKSKLGEDFEHTREGRQRVPESQMISPEDVEKAAFQAERDDHRWLFSRTTWPVSTPFTESSCHFMGTAADQNRKPNNPFRQIDVDRFPWDDTFAEITLQPTEESSDDDDDGDDDSVLIHESDLD